MSLFLPGIGDTGHPFGHVPPNSPDYIDRSDEQDEAIASQLEAAGEWLESFADAAREKNIKRMQQCRFLLVSCLVAIEGICSK